MIDVRFLLNERGRLHYYVSAGMGMGMCARSGYVRYLHVCRGLITRNNHSITPDLSRYKSNTRQRQSRRNPIQGNLRMASNGSRPKKQRCFEYTKNLL